MNPNCYVSVYILDAAYNFDNIFDYYADEDIRGKIKRGNFVTVPFGGGNKRRIAIVWEVKSSTQVETTKPVDKIVEVPALSEEQLELALYIKDNTFCTIGEALKVIAPLGLKTGLSVSYTLNEEKFLTADLDGLNEKMRLVLNFLVAGNVSLESMKEEFGKNITGVLNTLANQGFISKESMPERVIKEKFVKFAALSEDLDEEKYEAFTGKPLTELQNKIIDYLAENGETQLRDITDELSVSANSVERLANRGIVSIHEKEVFRDSADEYAHVPGSKDEDENFTGLTEDQKQAFESLADLYTTQRPCAALLRGVTGSGKTYVIKELIDTVVAEGKQVIMLVPEIALTPQTVIFFKNYYGAKVKILHSALSRGERFDTQRLIKSGEISIVIGTRSAIFAPFDNLGLIIMDEEQEYTYKSDRKPYYHARDIARFRCAKHGAMMLLTSATPSVESYYKAQTGVYNLVELDTRYNNQSLPEIIVADMRDEPPENRLSSLSTILQSEVAKNLINGEQSIIYKNRRGYNNFLSCRSCGEAVMCPNCTVSLKMHANERNGIGERNQVNRRSPNKLRCHCCGYSSDIPQACPKCESDHMHPFGSGTQRCEDDVAELFPTAHIARMDSDSTGAKNAHTRILNSVRSGEADILIGTQMVTKGHNFKNVTLVGVLLAEQGMLLDDYRANERTFEMLVQVAGRAGRYSKSGRAVVQTYMPENEIIQCAVNQDYKKFYEIEIRLRKAMVFPPFCDVCAINIFSEFENEAELAARKVGELLSGYLQGEYSDVKLLIYGPFPASVYKLNKNYRLRYIIKCKTNKRTKELFSQILREMGKQATKKVSVSVDVNPSMV